MIHAIAGANCFAFYILDFEFLFGEVKECPPQADDTRGPKDSFGESVCAPKGYRGFCASPKDPFGEAIQTV